MKLHIDLLLNSKQAIGIRTLFTFVLFVACASLLFIICKVPDYETRVQINLNSDGYGSFNSINSNGANRKNIDDNSVKRGRSAFSFSSKDDGDNSIKNRRINGAVDLEDISLTNDNRQIRFVEDELSLDHIDGEEDISSLADDSREKSAFPVSMEENIKTHWALHQSEMKAGGLESQVYCVLQCGVNLCCANGKVCIVYCIDML